MKRLEIQSSIGKSEIFVGETLTNVSQYLPKTGKIAIITDPVIHKLYGDKFPQADIVLEIPQGESNKCLQSLDVIFEQLIEAEFDRSSFILGIGGGIVCDMSGFIATIFMRGVQFGFVSTTLLGQVDASVGGKNGVNFRGIKNIIGTFNLPKFVICELEILKSLPQEELLSGMGEVVKYGAIYSESLFSYIESHIQEIKNFSLDVLENLVYESVVIKTKIVSHQGICPNGWHLITEKEMLAVSYATGGSTYIEDRMSSLASEVSFSVSIGLNTSGMSFVAAGYRGYDYEKLINNVFVGKNNAASYDYPEEYPSREDRCRGGGISKYSSFDSACEKKWGASVRCVKNY